MILFSVRMTAEYLDENQGVWFAEGSEVLIISADEVWAECYNQDGEVGVVPMNHLENIGEPVTAFWSVSPLNLSIINTLSLLKSIIIFIVS